MDETYVRVEGKWRYLYRALDSSGATLESSRRSGWMIRDLTRCSEQAENKAMKETNLRTHRTVARLPLADHMNRFITGDRAPCSPEGAKMLTCANPTFDGLVVLFQDIIEVCTGRC